MASRSIRPWVILASGWAIFVLYAFPGVMTMDSFDQLREGRTWFFTDSHPPVMAALWGVIDRVVPGPIGMLVLQGTTFLAGTNRLLCRAMRPRRAATCAVVILLFPPILAPLAVIWKDCVMAGTLVLGASFVLDERRRMRIVGLVLFTVATAVRYNALAATFPLVVLLFEWKPMARWYFRYAVGVGVWLLVVVVAMTSNALLTDREMHYWHGSSTLADITGVLAKVDRDIPDSELEPLLRPTGIRVESNLHAAVRAKYRPYDFQQLISGDDRLWDVLWNEPIPESRQEAVSRAWKAIVPSHLGAYIRYRLDTFAETIGLRRKYKGATVIVHSVQYVAPLEELGIGNRSSWFQARAEKITMWFAKHTRLFRPHFYLALALIFLYFARRQRDVLALLLSGVLMELTLVPLGWTPDFRFSHWLTACTCIAFVMLVARRAKGAA